MSKRTELECECPLRHRRHERCLSVAAGGTYRVSRHIGIDAEWFELDGTPPSHALQVPGLQALALRLP